MQNSTKQLNIPDGPFFVPPGALSNTGAQAFGPPPRSSSAEGVGNFGRNIDFLKMRNHDVRLITAFFPGGSPKRKQVRPYSLFCWAVHAFKRVIQEGGERTESTFSAYLKKLDRLFACCLELTESGEPDFSISKSRWQGDHLPFLKTNKDGLALLDVDESGLYKLTDKGEALAVAMDSTLQHCGPAYSQLCSLEALDETTEKEVASHLSIVWSSKPSEAEKEVFRSILHQPGTLALTEVGLVYQRTASIELIRACLKNKKPLSPHKIRKALLAPLKDEDLPENKEIWPAIHYAQTLWRTLKLHQAQRLAFEVIALRMADATKGEKNVPNEELSVSAHLMECVAEQDRASTHVSYFSDECTLLEETLELAEAARSRKGLGSAKALTAKALQLLRLVAAGVEPAGAFNIKGLFDDGCNPFQQAKTVLEHHDRPDDELLLYVAEYLAKRRIQSGQPTERKITEDRLGAVLALLADCGLLAHTAGTNPEYSWCPLL